MARIVCYFLYIVNWKASFANGIDIMKDTMNDILFPYSSVKNACMMKSIDTVIDMISMNIIIFSMFLLYLVYGYKTLEMAV